MNKYSDTTKQFLLATKRSEIEALHQLASNCQVITFVCELIHQLQRERGISNIFLISKSTRFCEQRRNQIEASINAEEMLRSQLKAKYLQVSDSASNMRLFNLIALALQDMDHVPSLRRKIENQLLTAAQSTRAYCRVISALLAVVFEASDVASDPKITQQLVALFNFIQGKEFAGQERAWGVVGFSQSTFDKRLCERIKQLEVSQQDSFKTFFEFALESDSQQWQSLESADSVEPLSQMRTMIQQLANGTPIAAEISEVWYELTTARIDKMHTVEEQLSAGLLNQTKSQVAKVEDDLLNHRKRVNTAANKISDMDYWLSTQLTSNEDAKNTLQQYDIKNHTQTDQLTGNRAFYDLIKEQSDHIKRMELELDTAKQAFVEHKKIDRAKLLIMQEMNFDEAEAHRVIQRRAMDEQTSLMAISETIIKTAAALHKSLKSLES
ncbi:nitrate regulatory protein [Paraglaciecola marina]|uniref:nitrate regulatory protein n=1 Tax=Paraglaciecola marina TaxID=2500157 RepID=UPI00105DFD94|nr:nitrate regulatory protein [Paraglaciecola marina]